MKYAIQVVITTDEGQTETRDITCVEREDLTPTTLGLTLADGKAILKALQTVVVEPQLTVYLEMQRSCTHCGHLQRSKGYHTTQVQTVLGTISVQIPTPNGPLTVGIDGGYVRAQGKQGWFEVIAGKSLLAFTRGEGSQEPVSSKRLSGNKLFE